MSIILVPVDFSLASQKALEYALNLMNKELDKVILFHVYALPIPDPEISFEIMSKMGESYHELAQTQITKLIEKTRLEHGTDLNIAGEAVPGFPADAILNQIKEKQVDLVVMGMRGQNKFLKKLIGTTASWVTKRTEVPVIVVPESGTYRKIRKIAYATNLEEEDIIALDSVIKLANQLESEIHCVHIQKQEEILDTYKKELLEEAYQDELVHGTIHVNIEKDEDILRGLNKYVELENIDLLVMLTHHKSILKRITSGSITWDMTFQSKVPVWIFKADSNLLKGKKVKEDANTNT